MSTLQLVLPFKMRNDLHLLRKIWHMATGLIGLWIYKAWHLEAKTLAFTLVTVGVASFFLELMRLKNERLNKFLMKGMAPLMRESEKEQISGLPYYAMGVGTSFYLFDERLATLSSLFLIFADPLASFFGILYGTTKLLPHKSLQGSIAAFSVCYLITLIFGLIYVGPSSLLLLFALLAGFVGCLSEMSAIFIDDNLLIPILSGAALTGLNFYFNLF